MRCAVLFAGIGGFELAARECGIETAWAAEWDEWKAARYRERFPGVPLYGDVSRIDGQRMVRDHGPIDYLFGSPPCTDISAANHAGKGLDGDSSRYYLDAIRIAGEARPRWCLFENSDRLRVRGADRVLSEMEGLGYTCWPIVVAAGHAGAPHIRRRSWLVAADAQRADLWQQSGRRRGADRRCSSVGRGHADDGMRPDADGQHRWPGKQSAHRSEARHGREQHPHADGDRQPDMFVDAEVGGRARADGFAGEGCRALRQHRDSDGAGLAERVGIGGDPVAELAASERAAAQLWDHEGARLARHCRMADGVPDWLARRWISAYGDAVVVPVVAAIIRGIQKVDAAWRREGRLVTI